jgi:predicted aldo/keto reductase-like oxidoreductase
MLKTDPIDLYQLHMVGQCYKPGDGTGVYEALEEAKREGKILHIGVTAHLIEVAFECVRSGLYETMQYPFSYLSMDKEFDLVKLCAEKNMGYIAMKSLAGGLITDSRVAMAFMNQQEHVLPIWGIQKESELDEWLSYMHKDPEMDDEARAVIARDREELSGEFCRGCAYCVPTCPQHITINQCARMGLMLRRAPSEAWLTEYWQNEMKKAETCIECGMCRTKCPYGLDTPRLLKENIEDYKKVLAGEIKVQ